MAVIQEDITKTTWEMILRFLGTGTEFAYNVLHEGNVALANWQDFTKESLFAVLKKLDERGLPKDQITLMLDRAEKGERVHTMAFPDEDAAELATRLTEAGIPCALLDSQGDDVKIVMFMSGDSDRVNDIITMFRAEKGIITELDPVFFLNNYAVDSIGYVDGIGEVELALFRQEAARNGLIFSCLETETENEYLVLHRVDDKAAVTKAMERVVWALSGEDGSELRAMLEKELANQELVRRALYEGKEEFYIVDGRNPQNYIRSSAAAVVYNKGGKVVTRAERGRADFTDRASRAAAGLIQPIVMDAREFIAYRAQAKKDEALLRGEAIVSAFEAGVKEKAAGAPPAVGGNISTDELMGKIAEEGKVHLFGLTQADCDALVKIAKENEIKAHTFTEGPDNVRAVLDATGAPALK